MTNLELKVIFALFDEANVNYMLVANPCPLT